MQRINFSSNRLRRSVTFCGIALVASLATLLAARARAAGIPAANALTYTGYLETPDGQPIATDVTVAIAVWDAVKGGNMVCEAKPEKVTPYAGRFQVALPDCQAPIGASPDLWLEATVDGTLLGRTKLGAVPYAVEANHALEASHASAADTATEGGPLALQVAGLQAGIDALTARLDVPPAAAVSKYFGSKVTINTATFTWVSGTDPAKLAAGRYWAFNTLRAWVAPSGCSSNCDLSGVLILAACMKVGNTITPAGSQVIAETPKAAGVVMSLPAPAIDFFDLSKATADVQFGLCARRNDVAATGWDVVVGNVYTAVMPQPK